MNSHIIVDIIKFILKGMSKDDTGALRETDIACARNLCNEFLKENKHVRFYFREVVHVVVIL